MKLINRDTDYAIKALRSIASTKNNSATVSGLSDELNLPHSFLRKILQILNKRGLLKSHKGKGGGFSLNEDADKISVFSLVEIFQGPFHLCEHIFKGKKCPDVRSCYFKKRLDSIEENTAKELRSITIANILTNDR